MIPALLAAAGLEGGTSTGVGMTNRREFLQVGIAATTLPLATQSVLAAAAPR